MMKCRCRLFAGAVLAAIALMGSACAGDGSAAAPAAASQQPAPAAPAPESQAPVVPTPAPAATAPATDPAPSPVYGGTASFFVRSDPRGGLEPHLPGGRREVRATIGLALEPLAIWDTVDGQSCSLSLRPLLAESWNFLDPTTVEVKLRQGVRFQNVPPVNGREMVADDVVFSWRRMFDLGDQATLASSITSMEAVDKYTVRLKADKPIPLIAQQLFGWRSAVIIAKEAAGEGGGFDQRENIIGTGPFILTEYTPGVGYKAEKHTDYRVEGRPYLDGLRLPIIRDQATRIAAVQVGDLDFMEEVQLGEREGLIGHQAPVRFVECTGGSTHSIWMRHDLPPFDDVRVRRAMSMALNREAVVEGLLKGYGAVTGLAPPDIKGALKPQDFPTEVRQYLQHNPEGSRRLLAEAGYPDGLDVSAFGTLQHGGFRTLMYEALPGMVKEAGFNMVLDPRTRAEYSLGVNDRVWREAAVLSLGGFPLEDMVSMPHSQNVPNRNRGAINDPETDRLIDQMLSTVDPEERLKIVGQIQIRIVEQAHFVAFPSPIEFFAVSTRLQGNLRVNSQFTSNARGLAWQDVWVNN